MIMDKIKPYLELYEQEYTDKKQIRIFVGTWNVNGQPAFATPVNIWLNCDPFPPDVYAIGFQELDLSKEAFLFNDSIREREWLNSCYNSLHHKAKYTKVKLIRLVGMMLIVFVKKELAPHVTNVAAVTVGTGLMRKMGNKGGVAIRLDLHNTSICFINSHLAAHVEEYNRRNQDYHEICSRVVFDQFEPPKLIKDHDQIYWLGDLNYRIDDLSTDEIKALVDQNAFEALLIYDQLKKQMLANRVFQGFEEPPIKHWPTYKYNPGTNEWDTSEKNRPPAWCDRILYKGGLTQPILYRSHPRLILSDHKPVSCLFSSTIKVIDEARYRKTYEKVMKTLDRLENESLPQVSLDKLEFVFDDVTLTEPVTDTIRVSNIGKGPVYFEFVKKLDNPTYCKSWLQVSPFTALVLPGKSVEVELRVFVGAADESDVNVCDAENTRLDDILVLHLDRGKDFFITVTVNLRKQEMAKEDSTNQINGTVSSVVVPVVDDDEPLIQL